MEEWKLVNKHEAYEVSSEGNFRRTDTKKPLVKVLSHNGYELIKFNIGLTKMYRVNRIVAQHFIPNPDNLPEVNHCDGNKLNNCKSNLEWSTRLHNISHAFELGLIKRKKGEYATNSKLTTDDVIEIFLSKLTETRNNTAERFNITPSNISLIQNGKSRFEEIKSNLDEEIINHILLSKNLVIKKYKIKRIIELDSKGNKIKMFENAKQIAEIMKCGLSSVTEVARGSKKSLYGRFFIYEDKFNEENAINRNLENERKELEK